MGTLPPSFRADLCQQWLLQNQAAYTKVITAIRARLDTIKANDSRRWTSRLHTDYLTGGNTFFDAAFGDAVRGPSRCHGLKSF